VQALENLAEAGMKDFKVSVVVTRENVSQLDQFTALTDRYGAQLRITRLRPSGRGADVWDQLHPTQPSSASSTRGCWPTATGCSPATPSSTCPRSGRPCPA
jgi:MoaA/NifB/PqqE/SkfB family radical SAM enzyme